MVQKPNRTPTRVTLAKNLVMLLRLSGISEAELARRAKRYGDDVSQKKINNIVNNRQSTGTDVLDAIAPCFGLTSWHIIRPELEDDIRHSQTIAKMVAPYIRETAEGRAILGEHEHRERLLGEKRG